MTSEAARLLVLNSGSSSLKFALYTTTPEAGPSVRYRGSLQGIGATGRFRVSGDGVAHDTPVGISNHEQALGVVLDWLNGLKPTASLTACGHRLVHGGAAFQAPVQIDSATRRELQSLVSLAPNHLPANLAGIGALRKLQPSLPQVACFDTAFHHTRPPVEQVFALPQSQELAAIRRYGFHGLSYEYIAGVLPEYLEQAADGRVIVAHLGHGASLCALLQRRSIATTMTFTPLDGIPMATRCGSLDAGVVLYLLDQGWTAERIAELLYFESGLLGVSGLSDDMQTLLDSGATRARFAVELFVHHCVRAIASLAATLGGIDALVFTAGIGEHSPVIRDRIARGCQWLGLALDEQANTTHRPRISRPDSRVSAWVIPTDEEQIIARHTHDLLLSHHLT